MNILIYISRDDQARTVACSLRTTGRCRENYNRFGCVACMKGIFLARLGFPLSFAEKLVYHAYRIIIVVRFNLLVSVLVFGCVATCRGWSWQAWGFHTCLDHHVIRIFRCPFTDTAVLPVSPALPCGITSLAVRHLILGMFYTLIDGIKLSGGRYWDWCLHEARGYGEGSPWWMLSSSITIQIMYFPFKFDREKCRFWTWVHF